MGNLTKRRWPRATNGRQSPSTIPSRRGSAPPASHAALAAVDALQDVQAAGEVDDVDTMAALFPARV